jgi:hypothetical protein
MLGQMGQLAPLLITMLLINNFNKSTPAAATPIVVLAPLPTAAQGVVAVPPTAVPAAPVQPTAGSGYSF